MNMRNNFPRCCGFSNQDVLNTASVNTTSGTIRPTFSAQGGCGEGLYPSVSRVTTLCTGLPCGFDGSWKHHVMMRSALEKTKVLLWIMATPRGSQALPVVHIQIVVISLYRIARGWDFFTGSLICMSQSSIGK